MPGYGDCGDGVGAVILMLTYSKIPDFILHREAHFPSTNPTQEFSDDLVPIVTDTSIYILKNNNQFDVAGRA